MQIHDAIELLSKHMSEKAASRIAAKLLSPQLKTASEVTRTGYYWVYSSGGWSIETILVDHCGIKWQSGMMQNPVRMRGDELVEGPLLRPSSVSEPEKYCFEGVFMVCEIFTQGGVLYVNKCVPRGVCRFTRRVMCRLSPFQGIKWSAFGQFTQTYRDSTVRGNHLHMYRMFTTSRAFDRDVELFRERYEKRTGIRLGEPR